MLIAESAEDAGLLIYNFKQGRLKSFYFEHHFSMYHFNLDIEKYTKKLEKIEEDETQDHLLDKQKR